MSFLLSSSVAPLARLVEVGEDERGHGLAANALPLGLRHGLLDQRLDVEALGGGAARTTAECRPSRQWSCATSAASSAVSTRAETGGPPSAR